MKHVGVVAALVMALALVGCSSEPQGSNTDPARIDAVEPPAEGACRMLTTDDVSQAANATETVDCAERHTAETYHVAELPEELDDVAHDDRRVGQFAHQRCRAEYRKHIGVDASHALRTTLSWVWFRPSQRAWSDGARWVRCDVIGGHTQSESLRTLPATSKGLLSGRPKDRWLVCAAGVPFPDAEKVPCSQPHDWRAVTTIKVGEPEDPYPGDTEVASRTDSFCESSVHAWLNYPDDYDFAITWFGKDEWAAGNRLSVCWARTKE